VLLLFLPCVLLVRCDLGGTDVPDIITTTALLCVLGYGLFVLPIAFVALALRLARWLWRVGQRSSFRSGLVAGVGAVLGALLPTCMVCSPPDPEADDPNERFGAAVRARRRHLGDEIDRKGSMEGSLSALADAATVIPGTTGPWKPRPPEPPLDSRLRSCVAQFTAPTAALATVEQAARWLISTRRADHDTANAVAYGTVFAVCRKHAREPVTGDLDQYFWRSVKNNYCKDLGRNALAQCSAFDTLDARCDGLPSVSGDQLDAAIDLRARLCRLDERDRAIVLRDFEGDTSEQIAAARGMTPPPSASASSAPTRRWPRTDARSRAPARGAEHNYFRGGVTDLGRPDVSRHDQPGHQPRRRQLPPLQALQLPLPVLLRHLPRPPRPAQPRARPDPAAPAPRGRLREAQLRRR
jgi:hypothetical protein